MMIRTPPRPADFDSQPTPLARCQVTPPPRASSPPHLRADATRAQKVHSAAAAVAALDPAGLVDLGAQLSPEVVSQLLARLLARPTGASTLANELPPAACQRLADATRAAEDQRKEEEEEGDDEEDGDLSEGELGDDGGADAPTGAE